jgi:hypothetical protein
MRFFIFMLVLVLVLLLDFLVPCLSIAESRFDPDRTPPLFQAGLGCIGLDFCEFIGVFTNF